MLLLAFDWSSPGLGPLTLWEGVCALDTTLDLVVHILLRVVGVNTRPLLDIIEIHEFLTTLLLERVLDEGSLALDIDPRESVAAVSMEVPAVRMTAVREEHSSRVVRLWHIGKEIEGSIIIDEEGLRVSALTSDVIRSLHGVSNEEDRPVQSDNVVVAFSGVELHGETSGVTCEIGKFFSESNGRES